jgi:hypothetical protein
MEAVKMEYYSKGLILPEHLRAHSTSDMATSWACETTSNFLQTGHRYIKMVSTSSSHWGSTVDKEPHCQNPKVSL